MEQIKPITIIGCGPGSDGYLSGEARTAAAGSDCLIGSKRLLSLFQENGMERVTVNANVQKTIDEIKRRYETQRIAVLVSGDPGISSLAKPVIKRFGIENCDVIPGVSSVQLAFARLGMDWLDAKIISAHGHDPDTDMESYRQYEKIAVLGGRDESIVWAHNLAKMLSGRQIFICENLSLSNEKIMELTIEQLGCYKAPSMTIVLLIQNGETQ
ncbi:MAG: precorrin-6y C5,15-methyltransferase (decarboxylating) subunit CbiE [Nitrospinota bacterium]